MVTGDLEHERDEKTQITCTRIKSAFQSKFLQPGALLCHGFFPIPARAGASPQLCEGLSAHYSKVGN